MIDIDKSLEIAKDAALLAGKFLISANNDAQKILADDGRDIKLQIDQDAENLITEYISTRSNLPILGPTIAAATSAATPPTACTIEDPAKSIKPASARKAPSPYHCHPPEIG